MTKFLDGDEDKQRQISDICSTQAVVDCSLDPELSEKARALIDRGKREAFNQAADECGKWDDELAELLRKKFRALANESLDAVNIVPIVPCKLSVVFHLFHKWGEWRQYTWRGLVYPGRFAPKEIQGKPIEVTKNRQRRQCSKCKFVQDEEID